MISATFKLLITVHVIYCKIKFRQVLGAALLFSDDGLFHFVNLLVKYIAQNYRASALVFVKHLFWSLGIRFSCGLKRFVTIYDMYWSSSFIPHVV